ncbi:MAG: glycosyltransferase [Hyphomonadaceae bacterium]|nr:glycosyltransferase [Hyphomonadaceae bacterium]MBC6412681.1 glycosyltransferase [Hyphomonadaceae bacterium]
MNLSKILRTLPLISKAYYLRLVTRTINVEYYQARSGLNENNPKKLARHYLVQGAKNNFDPVPYFSAEYYLSRYADVAESEIDPFIHYLLFGRNEGRLAHPNPNAKTWEILRKTENLQQHAILEQIRIIRPEFDQKYYQKRRGQKFDSVEAAIRDYLIFGEVAGLPPNRDFDPEFYFSVNPDIARSGISGFVHYVSHGHEEKRAAKSYFNGLENFNPLISVIIPNYNHAKFLDERVYSVAEQTYENLDIIIMDDCSTDDSVAKIRELMDVYSHKNVRFIPSDVNSGGVFSQWKKGIDLARGDFIWICESDDFCQLDFLEKLVPQFSDKSVNIAFGKIQFVDESGAFKYGMDEFREQSETGIWDEIRKETAKTWFNTAFGVNNVIANVGGCVFRRSKIPDSVWNKAKTYKIIGDWFLYLNIAAGGQIVFDPRPVAYFRQHKKNTSKSNFNKICFYEELNRVFREIDNYWPMPEVTMKKFLDNARSQFEYWKMPEAGFAFDDVFDKIPECLTTKRKPHILVGLLGFMPGGGEVFSINLANALRDRGYLVSMLATNMSDFDSSMYHKLERGIPVYSPENFVGYQRAEFLSRMGVDLVHSNVIGVEGLLFGMDPDQKIEVPYIVTLHGSHEGLNLSSPEASGLMALCEKNVSLWIYTAEKHKSLLQKIGINAHKVRKIGNGMPHDNKPFHMTRHDLGIPDDAFVFTLVARGIKDKGWSISIKVFQRLQEKVDRSRAHLLLVGDGDEARKATSLVRDGDSITHLGYQAAVNGIYKLTDCAIVPTRFAGESSPLCIIQALQENIPVIATDHGGIREMLTLGEDTAGYLIDYERSDRKFTEKLFNAMVEVFFDEGGRETITKLAPRLLEKFEMSRMILAYERAYKEAALSVPRN